MPTKTFETLFAYDNVGSSGNVEIDNNAVAFLDSATQNESRLDQEEAEVENEERTKVFDDLQLENPNLTPPTAPVIPATGQQVNARTFEALFPNDPTGAAIARKGPRNV